MEKVEGQPEGLLEEGWDYPGEQGAGQLQARVCVYLD